jgi:hypothetical protein
MALPGLFLWALWWNAGQLQKGYRAAHGSYGVPGTATIRGETAGKGRHCYGDFRSQAGESRAAVRIEHPGDCTRGRQGPARLVEGDHGDTDHISGDEQDVAWMVGSHHWVTSAVLTGVFGLISLFGLFLWLMGLFVGASRLLRAVTPTRE